MNSPTWLIDTNILIGLEDDHVLAAAQSEFAKLARQHGVQLRVHEAGAEDIARDTDEARRKITISKYKKYPVLARIPHLTRDQLASRYGSISKPNDEVDCRHLHALVKGAVQALVTEDNKLHARAQAHAPQVANSVFRVAEAVERLKTLYGERSVGLTHVAEMEAHQIDEGDPIFNSLRDGYADFDKWWATKCVGQGRKVWAVFDDGAIGGVIVRKDETVDDTDALTPAQKILKICTFKVRPESRGHSLGEHLLKQALWHCIENDYDLAYLTTYPEQEQLIGMLELYGFENTGTKGTDGELVFEKRIQKHMLAVSNAEGIAGVFARYPSFGIGDNVSAFGIPIREPFHDILFPELNTDPQTNIFDALPFAGPMKPGNTIRKVYICRAQSKLGKPGSLLFFYKSRSDHFPSQAMTAVGILESVGRATTVAELVTATGGRSVYSQANLEGFKPTPQRPVKVINFLLAGYLSPAWDLAALKTIGIVKGQPQQSIYKIEDSMRDELLSRLKVSLN